MAVIHHTTLRPTKVELLSGWLPTRPWYRGGEGAPVLAKSGGFRLDDPEGEVGIEIMVVTDTSALEPVAYLVPLSYRGAPLEGAEQGLIGTMEHGVLGKRWVYDGVRDPVLVAEVLALIEGKAQAMAQSVSDTPDHEVVRSCTGAGSALDDLAPGTAEPAEPADDQGGTRLSTALGAVLRLHRVLRTVPGPTPPSPELADGVLGHVATTWQGQGGAHVSAVLMTVHAA